MSITVLQYLVSVSDEMNILGSVVRCCVIAHQENVRSSDSDDPFFTGYQLQVIALIHVAANAAKMRGSGDRDELNDKQRSSRNHPIPRSGMQG